MASKRGADAAEDHGTSSETKALLDVDVHFYEGRYLERLRSMVSHIGDAAKHGQLASAATEAERLSTLCVLPSLSWLRSVADRLVQAVR